jgi:hypothetical protein
MHTYIHTYIHTHTHTYTDHHTDSQRNENVAQTWMPRMSNASMYMHTCIHTHIHTQIITLILKEMKTSPKRGSRMCLRFMSGRCEHAQMTPQAYEDMLREGGQVRHPY